MGLRAGSSQSERRGSIRRHRMRDGPAKERRDLRHAVSLQNSSGLGCFGNAVGGSLSTIIGSFKSAASNRIHKTKLLSGPVWQSRFHDRIIRNYVERFYIEQYIELNPLLWHLDADNPFRDSSSEEHIRNVLEEQYGLDGSIVEWIIDRGITL
jgi:hypothetical protein